MSDLRNNSFQGSAPMMSEEFHRSEGGFGEKHVLHDNGGLSSFHHFEEAEKGSSQGKLIGGALVVALLLGAAGIYAYTGSNPAIMASKAPAASVASNAPAAPIQTAPMSPPPAPDVTSGTIAKSPYDAQPAPSAAPASATASAMPDANADKPAKVKSARAHIAKDAAAQSNVEAQQTAELNRNSAADRATRDGSVSVPLPAAPSVASSAPVSTPADNGVAPDMANAGQMPVPPAPPASSMASNGQASPLTPEAGNTATDIPAAPQPQPATPAPDQPQ